MNAIIVLIMIFAGLLGGIGQVSFKKGSKKFSPSIKGIIANKQFMLGVLCYGLATLIFLGVLKYADLSYAYPLVSITYLWVILLSKFILKEKIGAWKIAGVLLIIAGIVLVNI
jgi:drug/metabolite transporter (DMT)-like permease